MAGAPVKEAVALLEEVRLLFHAAAHRSEVLHGGAVTASMRGVLEHLLRLGPCTVPAIAAARGVSRQHIQALVHALLAQSLVILQENPAHRRSARVALTAAGEDCIRAMQAREAAFLQVACASLEGTPLVWARGTLASLRAALTVTTEDAVGTGAGAGAGRGQP